MTEILLGIGFICLLLVVLAALDREPDWVLNRGTPGKIILDGTFGAGGYTQAILDHHQLFAGQAPVLKALQ